MASSGQITSPTATPAASGTAARTPPVAERAISAATTGPGVAASTASAPA